MLRELVEMVRAGSVSAAELCGRRPAVGKIFLNADATLTSYSSWRMATSHMTATTAAPPAVGTRLKYGAPPPSRSPTSPGGIPPAPGSRWPHMGRDD